MRKLKALWFCCLSMVPPAVGQAFNTLAFVIILYPNHSSLIMPNRSVKEAHMHGSRSIALGCQHSGLGLHEMDTLFPHPFQDGQMNAQKGKELLQACGDYNLLECQSPRDSALCVVKTLSCLPCSETTAQMVCFICGCDLSISAV